MTTIVPESQPTVHQEQNGEDNGRMEREQGDILGEEAGTADSDRPRTPTTGDGGGGAGANVDAVQDLGDKQAAEATKEADEDAEGKDVAGADNDNDDNDADDDADEYEEEDEEEEGDDGDGSGDEGRGEDGDEDEGEDEDEDEDGDEDDDQDGGDKTRDGLQRAAKTKAQRDAARGKKAGNQGRFKGDQLKLLETFVEAYIRIPKAFWSSFTWKEARRGMDEEYNTLKRDKVIAKTNGSIKSFFRWRAKSSAAGTSNPWQAIMSVLRAPPGPAPRLLPPWQIFHTLNAEAVTVACEKLKKEGRAVKKRIALRNQVAQQLFEELQPQERTQYENMAKERVQREIEVYRKALEATPSANAADQLEARKRLSSVVTPLLKLVSEYTGLPCLTLLAGQAEKTGDEYKYEVYSIHHGKTTEPVPRDLAQFDGEGFQGVFLGHFAKFLRNCALKPMQATEPAIDPGLQITLNPFDNPSPDAPTSTAVAADENATPQTPRRPRNAGRGKGKQTKHMSVPQHDTVAEQQRRSAGTDEAEEREEREEREHAANDPEADESDENSSDDEELPIPEEATPALRRRLRAMNTPERNAEIRMLEGLTPFDFEHECIMARNKEAMREIGFLDPMTKPSAIKRKRGNAPGQRNPPTSRSTRSSVKQTQSTGLSATRENQDLTILASGETISADTSSSVGDRLAPVPTLQIPGSPQTGSSAEPSAVPRNVQELEDDITEIEIDNVSPVLPEAARDQWLAPFFAWLSKEPVPEEARADWVRLLHNWVSLEAEYGFVSSRVGLPRKNRPDDVDLWIKNARTGRIVFRRAHSVFQTQWFKWWDTLNPSWRIRENERLVTGAGEGPWDSLLYSGTNGFLNVVASLSALLEATTDQAGWVIAMKDVGWVVEEVLAAKRSQRKHAVDDPAVDSRPAKKRRVGA